MIHVNSKQKLSTDYNNPVTLLQLQYVFQASQSEASRSGSTRFLNVVLEFWKNEMHTELIRWEFV